MASKSDRETRIRSFGDQMREFRDRTGITFDAVAASMSVTASYISHMIRRGPTTDQIERIADAFGVKATDFDEYHLLKFNNRFSNLLKADDEGASAFASLMVRYERTNDAGRKKIVSRLWDLASR